MVVVSLFSEIESAIIEVLQKHLEEVPKDRISIHDPKDRKYLPAVSIKNVEFEISEVGLGRSLRGEEVQIHDRFSGDGENTEFQLTEKPLRPIQRVEYPMGTIIRPDQYVIDYQLSRIIFHSPPAEGEDNISVRYIKPMITKGLIVNITYHIKVWSDEESERDSLAVECIKAFLIEESYLNQTNVFMKPVRGFNQNPSGVEGAYCKVLEYLVEGKIQVEQPHPRMEKIEFQKDF